MKTIHKVFFGNSASMHEISDNSVDLMVTSPPYPMIAMWDEVFSKQNSAIGIALEKKQGLVAFELMHIELDRVWKEVYRVLKPGGFVCINIGDATRTLDNEFRLYSNHSRILQTFSDLGFNVLPEIIWRKQTNAPNKFMGSGMLPAGAYVTLEHEFILIFRKGGKRQFETPEEKLNRRESSYFYEERNLWFSDVWQDLKGTQQRNNCHRARRRSGAFPFELPYRLINMFSVKGDTVLDPFSGTGTTMLAAMAATRSSIGFEIDSRFKEHLISRFAKVLNLANEQIGSRLIRHLLFADKVNQKGKPLGYDAKYYEFKVMTKQERELVFDKLSEIRESSADVFEVEYERNALPY
jgi:DNA modification methylase